MVPEAYIPTIYIDRDPLTGSVFRIVYIRVVYGAIIIIYV